MKYAISAVAILTVFFLISQALAQNKVVVVPLSSAKELNNVVTVSKRGGDFTDPVAAVNSISGANDTNPYLVLIGPGFYTITQTLQMKSYVTIAGSGRKATTLSGAISTDVVNESSAMVSGANNAILRDLTIKNTGGDQASFALYNDGSSPIIRNVTLEASGGSTDNTGVYNYNSSPIMTDVAVTVSGGTDNTAVYNIASSSPVMNNVTATAKDGTSLNFGVYNNSSLPVMTNVTAKASGAGANNTGVHNLSSSPDMTHVTVTASGGSNNVAVTNSDSAPTMTYVIATASGANSYGVANSDASPIIRHSTLEGGTYGLSVIGEDATTRVMQSSIIGGVIRFNGTLTCVNSDDGQATALGANCM